MYYVRKLFSPISPLFNALIICAGFILCLNPALAQETPPDAAEPTPKKVTAYKVEGLEIFDLEREDEVTMLLGATPEETFPEQFELLWETQIAGASPYAGSGPELFQEGDYLYYLSLGRCMTKVKMSTGEIVWGSCFSYRWEENSAEFGGFTIKDGLIYLVSSSGNLVKLNEADGKPVWQRYINLSLRGNPLIHENQIVVRTADNRVLSFLDDTGKLAWIQRAPHRRFGVLDNLSPMFFEQSLVVTHASGFLQRIVPKNGVILWQLDLFEETPFGYALREQLRDVKADPLIDDNTIYITAYSDQTVAVDLASGETKWTTAISSITPAILSGNALFVVDTFNNLIALNKENGKAFWMLNIKRTIEANTESQDGQVQIDSEFALKYKQLRGQPFWMKMLLLKEQLVLISDLGIYLIFSPSSGELTGYGTLPSDILVGPLLIDGVLYFIDVDNYLVALKSIVKSDGK